MNRGEVIAQKDPSVEADRLFEQATELFDRETAESKKQAIEIWEKAMQLDRKVGDRTSEALTFLFIGRVYDDLGEKKTAL
ncbi:MAG: hypothetical protein WBA93_01715 [Microcoleaceae cyanobacterium]